MIDLMYVMRVFIMPEGPMFLIRSVQKKDLKDLFDLSKQANLLNLPSDSDKLLELITKSEKSFNMPSKHLEANYYVFCLEDTTINKVVGVSMIHGKHGTPEKPHYFLRVDKEVKESNSLQKKIVNHTLKLGIEPNGFTEIGGLILDKSYRGNPKKLGKFLSMSRFLYIVLHRHLFTPIIHSELLPPFDKNGKSLLWEGLGRRFLNMDYWEADILSQKDKTFIHDLFPSSTIYQNLLPKSALAVIGKVGDNTKPVQSMLERIGFKYTNEVDPFDGGPHYRAKLTELEPFKKLLNEDGSSIKNKIVNDKQKLFLCNIPCVDKPGVLMKIFNFENKTELDDNQIYAGFFI